MKSKSLFFLFALTGTIFLTRFIDQKPKILIIGDSISIGYMSFVEKSLEKEARLYHNPGNARHTAYGLEHISNWIGEVEWDIIQFNWGLHDLCYRNPDSINEGHRDKIHGKITNSLEQYTSNLDSIVSVLKSKTNAKLIFVTTTYVPKDELGRFTEDVVVYNEAAKKIMEKHGVIIIDIYKESISIHNKYGLGSDDVHYIQQGKDKLGHLIAEKIKEELKQIER